MAQVITPTRPVDDLAASLLADHEDAEETALPELIRTTSHITRHDPALSERPSSSSTIISSYRTSPYPSPAPSNTSLGSSPEEDGGINFPTYDSEFFYKNSSMSDTPPPSPYNYNYSDSLSPAIDLDTPTNESSPDPTALPHIADDTAIREEPSTQVDYLSHDWREEDIWCSWRHIVNNRKVYGERSRLENASWRTWAKSKYRLSTVSPEKLNWMKDCDVTWLYGPLQTPKSARRSHSAYESTTNLTKSNSFLDKKPCLKKRSVSELMLQKSLSSSSLVRQAAEAVNAQRNLSLEEIASPTQRSRPTPSDFVTAEALSRGSSKTDFSDNAQSSSCSSSGLSSRDGGASKRHIRFDPTVEQRISVDFKQSIVFEEPEFSEEFGFSSEDEPVMMKSSPKLQTPGSSRGSFSSESKGIAMLPSTKLKNHGEDAMQGRDTWRSGSRLPNSPSQETLRPSRPGRNFLLDENTDGGDSGPLRRTNSGMLMPFDDSEEEFDYVTGTFIGRVMDTFNTARDIGHVIWNVGWRK